MAEACYHACVEANLQGDQPDDHRLLTRPVVGPMAMTPEAWMKRRAVNPILWSLGLLLLSGAGPIYFAVHAHASNKQQVQSRLEALAHQVADQLQQRFRLYEYGLRGARGAVIAADHEDISNDVFARYMESRDTEHEFPGSRGFGFVARVAPAKIDSFLARVRKEGRRNLTLHELGPNAGDRFIIKFIEPLVPNAEAVGLDIASEKVQRDAAVAAMKSGKATLTGPITLVQASGGKKQSMLCCCRSTRVRRTASPARGVAPSSAGSTRHW